MPGKGAFQNCNSLKNINLSGLTKIEESLFSGVEQVDVIDLPSVKQISGDFAFENCKALKVLKLPLLESVDPSFESLFKGVGNGLELHFGANPPHTFASGSTLVVPSQKKYDNDLSVNGDSSHDKMWCGITLTRIGKKSIGG